PALPERISQPVHQTLLDLGVKVLTGAAVSEVTADGLHTKQGEFVPA
ncbi:MAG TPA: FAD-dependent oxidoreductase, partial [Pseudomonas sp.]|nr:FAD-dependent oxidoreductase [Pseudomonas sp.]